MLITTQEALEEICADFAQNDFLTIDTEFLREKTYYSKLCLIQMGAPDGRAVAIDPLVKGLDLTPFFEILANESILKIVHAGRQDLEIFYQLTKAVPKPLFDTQIAAMVCGYGEQVGYEALVNSITGQQLDKSVQFTDWSHRPLSEKQLNYALGDVTYLVELYQHFADKLKKDGRTEWVYEEEAALCDPATYENDPGLAWRRVKIKSPKPKMLAMLRVLAAWREEKAQHRNIPRSWVMRDETLADMAAQAPKDVKGLKKIRGVSAELAEGKTGAKLLQFIAEVEASDSADWPKPQPKKKPLHGTAAATSEMLRMLLKIKSAQYGVAAKLIASTDHLHALALSDQADVPALKGWRYELFGEDALALKSGKIALGLKDGKVDKYDISATTEE